MGVFDSGVGGLSVLSEVRRELPNEHLFYVADSLYAPYGDKSQTFIEERSFALTRFLLDQGAKAIVVACNTATGAAVSALRSRYEVPIVAIEPAIKPAVAQTRSGVVGVLATSRTLTSPNFLKLSARYNGDVDIIAQACPGLVEQVEAGDLDGPETRRLLSIYIRPLLDKGADTLVLGCTHYPFLHETIRAITGTGISVIDSSIAVARQLRRRLEAHSLLSVRLETGSERFWSSAPPEKAAPALAKIWGPDAKLEILPDAFIK